MSDIKDRNDCRYDLFFLIYGYHSRIVYIMEWIFKAERL